MSGQAAACTREEVRSEIKKVEHCHGNSGGNSYNVGKESMKTTNKK